jgi:isopenicillin-N N-acyltransferase-like protein
MRGVAYGAGVLLEEVIALNSRYELVWSQMGSNREGCTSLAALPEATESGHTLLAQNWDYKVGVRDRCIILEILQDGKPTVVTHTEAGIIGHKGLNSEGLGLVGNAVVSDKDRFELGVPIRILCRRILNSRSLSEAMRIVLNTKKGVSTNFMLAQAEGTAVDLESTPIDVSILTPQKGVLAHTNHFIGSRSLSVKDVFLKSCPDSIYRYTRARSYLEKRVGCISEESFMEVLRDHFGKPNSICAHENPAVEEDYRCETLASLILDLENGSILITKGPPCGGPYQRLNFPCLNQLT